MPPPVLSLHHRRWTLFGLGATGFGLLMLLLSISGGEFDSEDRLLRLRFEAAVSQAVKTTQQRIAEHDRLLGTLTLQFNYLGTGTDRRFTALLREQQLPDAFPAITRAGYLMLDQQGRLQAREFRADAAPVETASVLRRLPLESLERPLSYARDFNVLALSAVLPGDASASVRADAAEPAGRTVMLVRPVYDNTTVGISRGSRRQHHRGWIYALVNTERLLAGVEESALGPLDVSVYDGLSRQSEQTLLFGSHRWVAQAGEHGLQSVRPVGLASRAWTQVVRLGQGDLLAATVPAEKAGHLPLWLLLLAGMAAGYWSKIWWLRRQVQREDTRAF